MDSKEIEILGKSYSFYTDETDRLEDIGRELDMELKELQDKYSQFTRDHIFLLQLLRWKTKSEDRDEEQEALTQADSSEEQSGSEQLDLEIDEILNSEF